MDHLSDVRELMTTAGVDAFASAYHAVLEVNSGITPAMLQVLWLAGWL